jgi:intracellular septation protein
MWFFIVMACANEIIWRNFSEDIWVNFKVFGAMPITIIFVLLQMPFIIKNKIPEDA